MLVIDGKKGVIYCFASLRINGTVLFPPLHRHGIAHENGVSGSFSSSSLRVALAIYNVQIGTEKNVHSSSKYMLIIPRL